ncbi:hypothetical protein PAHAL_2G403600 [Panicum hallii]|uniref:Uncharacterized protein n=1 Tax=Panicum hallii TaxID=206008 RepID=A0A2S3H3G4_9POAL|nr:hypothetical protein PAHAL_2G403600 [Panicum hallii]
MPSWFLSSAAAAALLPAGIARERQVEGPVARRKVGPAMRRRKEAQAVEARAKSVGQAIRRRSPRGRRRRRHFLRDDFD